MTNAAPARPAGLVDLPADHPGCSDAAYRARRDAISAVGAAHRPGDPIPDVEYAPEEDALWTLVSGELAAKHERFAVREYRDAAARLDLPHDRVPQLRQVSAVLDGLTGFRVAPVPGLVPTRVFYGSLADRTFCSTQYIRHHSVPLYTPEPDVVHELVGHCNMLASPVFAELSSSPGRPPDGPSPTPRSSSSAGSSGSPSSSAWRGRTASCARTAPASSRPSLARRLPWGPVPPVRPDRDGHDRLRHHRLQPVLSPSARWTTSSTARTFLTPTTTTPSPAASPPLLIRSAPAAPC